MNSNNRKDIGILVLVALGLIILLAFVRPAAAAETTFLLTAELTRTETYEKTLLITVKEASFDDCVFDLGLLSGFYYQHIVGKVTIPYEMTVPQRNAEIHFFVEPVEDIVFLLSIVCTPVDISA